MDSVSEMTRTRTASNPSNPNNIQAPEIWLLWAGRRDLFVLERAMKGLTMKLTGPACTEALSGAEIARS
jgi:hypothetical protein